MLTRNPLHYQLSPAPYALFFVRLRIQHSRRALYSPNFHGVVSCWGILTFCSLYTGVTFIECVSTEFQLCGIRFCLLKHVLDDQDLEIILQYLQNIDHYNDFLSLLTPANHKNHQLKVSSICNEEFFR